ncbi:MAG: 50S ribosomal protein L13 [Solobacterium sp.]|nr:50S ribosomal protein L13 [Solobacterium sp.]MDY3793528.1 50S ribosomal protein L13 [Erysipelotrichaceae bacterium]MCI6846719.1 50S ribosomal protein L13 [Solobacterium sp.]MCI6878915.1 50S ribosomal protein L13 [Solobacterium sp.]MCI7157582.1 50S ribosomal protein L13 [Solobacterium sp.]
MRQTTMLKAEEVKKEWYVIDAEGQTLGRLATKVAAVLRGKHKPTYTPNVDCGDYVIVINAEKVVYSGDQEEKKIYYHHTMFPGGLKSRSIGLMKREYPVELVEHAIQGMLPHNKLGDRMRTHLFVYEGANHPHAAQKPMELK